MKLLFRFLTIVAFLNLTHLNLFSQSNALEKEFRIMLDRIYCYDQTENLLGRSADEVYILIFAQKSSGEAKLVRTPGLGNEWNMTKDPKDGDDNPNGNSHAITNKEIFYETLKENEYWDLAITVCEYDSWNSSDLQSRASEVLIASGNPYAAGAGAILGALNLLGVKFEDSDDWMGMIGARISFRNGKLRTSWTSKGGIVNSVPAYDKMNPSKYIFRMNHDGSDYECTFNCEDLNPSKNSFRIKSHWKGGYLMSQSSGLYCCGTIEDDNINFEIEKETDFNYCYIKTNKGKYISRNNGSLFLGTEKSAASLWFLEEVAGQAGKFRIKDRANSTYINIEPGTVVLTPVADYFLSAWWQFEPAD